MTKYVALLRAANVGGTGKISMADLKSMCGDAGFARVETYIASGNVVFESQAAPSRVKAELEARLFAYAGKAVAVMIRTAAEMAAILKANPFPEAEPKHNYVIFLDHRPPRSALEQVVGLTDEKLRLGAREIFVSYPSGLGRSKLKIPAAKAGTARNRNTVAKLAEIAARMS
jgi:uncharacterized protein (DUF1697 family)